MGTLAGHANCFGHRVGINQDHPRRGQGIAQHRRVAANQHHSPRMARDRVDKWRKVLAFSLTPEDQDHFAVRPQTGQCGHGGADIGALAVVEILDALHDAHGFDAMGLPAVFSQAEKH